jgi:hypothetical protein
MMKLERYKLEKLLEALQELDVKAAPHGLYAIREHQAREGEFHPQFKMEWDLALRPVLKELKCNPQRIRWMQKDENYFSFQDTSPILGLAVVRCSKIKVRRFGNAYRVDPHHDFSERWNADRMEKLLAWAAEYDKYVLLFMGFSDEKRPFVQELQELETTKAFQEKMAEPIRRVWDDPHGRGFKVMVSMWYASGEMEA